jgi:hypothetical protein
VAGRRGDRATEPWPDVEPTASPGWGAAPRGDASADPWGAEAPGGRDGGVPSWGDGEATAVAAPRGATERSDPIRPSRAERLREGASSRSRPQPGGARAKKVWPRVLTIMALIVFAMVACWLWVFPWLESVLPSEF